MANGDTTTNMTTQLRNISDMSLAKLLGHFFQSTGTAVKSSCTPIGLLYTGIGAATVANMYL